MSFAGKVVLITGASSGIGAETAIHFAQLDASLSITGRNKHNLEKVAEQCGKSKPFIVTGDLANENDVKNIIDSTIKHYGKLDILVNNAGIVGFGNIETPSLEQYDNIMNVNVRSVFQLTALAVPHLSKTKGNIVNVSSVAGLRPLRNILSYCMSKAALDQFTRCVALELASRQVRVNAVNPGAVQTNILQNTGLSQEQIKIRYEQLKGMHALARNGDSLEIAKTITFLASDDASFMTGVTLLVDGGWHIVPPEGVAIHMSFTGKVILITGASSGIGAETAIHFAQLGASLSITGRNKHNLEKIAEQCGQLKPIIITGDLANENDVKNIIDSTIKHYGKLDVLVNNAGIVEFGNIETTSLKQYDNIMNVNVRSVFQLTALAIPHLVKTKGNIVNVSSIGGLRPLRNNLPYCMSKAALDQFTRCVALELASGQVRVNAVNPGAVPTNILRNSGMTQEQLKNHFEQWKGMHALERNGDSSEIAKTIAFLASDGASFITGVTLLVDGGWHVVPPEGVAMH